jgi:hypothetical protein
LIDGTTNLIQVYVRPAQAFARLRELNRLTPDLLEKLTPLFEVEEVEEVEKFVEVEDDGATPEENVTKRMKSSKKKPIDENESLDLSLGNEPSSRFACPCLSIP